MSYNKMKQDESHGLSYEETLFLSYQKVPKAKISGSYLNKGDWLPLLIRSLSIKVTLKSKSGA